MTTDKHDLSIRGNAAAASLNKLAILEVLANLWHPTSNPSGFVSLGVAENVRGT